MGFNPMTRFQPEAGGNLFRGRSKTQQVGSIPAWAVLDPSRFFSPNRKNPAPSFFCNLMSCPDLPGEGGRP